MIRKRISAAILVALLAVLGIVAGAPARAEAAVPKQILVLGDSITGGASNYINFYLTNDGKAQTTFRTVGGQALCDLLPGNGGPWTLQSLLAAKRYDAVIVTHSGNNITPCMGGRTGEAAVQKYKADANTIMGITRQYGVPTVVWAKPFAARDAGLDYIRNGVGRVYVDLALTNPTAKSIDAGPGLEDQGQWAEILPCAPWDPCGYGVVRIGDPDGVHLWCDERPPAYYGVVPPCSNYSAANNRYGMNISAARPFIGI